MERRRGGEERTARSLSTSSQCTSDQYKRDGRMKTKEAVGAIVKEHKVSRMASGVVECKVRISAARH